MPVITATEEAEAEEIEGQPGQFSETLFSKIK